VALLKDMEKVRIESDRFSKRLLGELVIYECHVSGMTQHYSSEVRGNVETFPTHKKFKYLCQLGIKAEGLLPIFDFDENKN
jgi:glycogen operon protein|tara:strand:+ start:681 stop:923 length:243 start_codon:yes stop_codon:yes gene_type:complete